MPKLFNQRDNDTSANLEAELFAVLEPSERDVERAAENPFLARRLMVSIAAERRRREEAAARWSLSFGVALRATPALAVITLLFFALSWYWAPPAVREIPAQNKVVRVEDNPIATSELPMITNEDLMSIMLGSRPVEPRRGQ